jgi:hypothetical protein
MWGHPIPVLEFVREIPRVFEAELEGEFLD